MPTNTDRPKIILGAGMYGGPRTSTAEEVKAQADLFRSYGHNTFDTSRAYPLEAFGRSEEILTESGTTAWANIDTKINATGTRHASKERIAEGIDESLKALKVNSVDVLYLTLACLDVEPEESAEAMDLAYRQGKFKRFGISNMSPEEVENFCAIADRRGFVKPTVYQGQYNPVARKAEKELLPMLRKHKIAFYAYTPTGAGIFSGKISKESVNAPEGRFSHNTWAGKFYSAAYFHDQIFENANKVHNAALEHGFTGHAAALRWCLHHSVLRKDLGDAVLISAARLEQLEENLKICDDGPLPDDLVRVIDSIWPEVEEVAPWAWIDVKNTVTIQEGVVSDSKKQ